MLRLVPPLQPGAYQLITDCEHRQVYRCCRPVLVQVAPGHDFGFCSCIHCTCCTTGQNDQAKRPELDDNKMVIREGTLQQQRDQCKTCSVCALHQPLYAAQHSQQSVLVAFAMLTWSYHMVASLFMLHSASNSMFLGFR